MIIPVVYPLNMRGVVAVNSHQIGLILTPTKVGSPAHYEGIGPDGSPWAAIAPSVVGRLETWLAAGIDAVDFSDWCQVRGCTAHVPPGAGQRFIQEMQKHGL